jgi:hypothetical protein
MRTYMHLSKLTFIAEKLFKENIWRKQIAFAVHFPLRDNATKCTLGVYFQTFMLL